MSVFVYLNVLCGNKYVNLCMYVGMLYGVNYKYVPVQMDVCMFMYERMCDCECT